MKTKMLNKICSCVYFLLTSLSISKSQNTDFSELKTLNIVSALKNQQEIFISNFLSEIKYIPLETRPDILISSLAIIEVSSEYIIVKTRNSGVYQIFLFDRNTGKFIREIGRQGRGPGEFLIWSLIPYNSQIKEFYAVQAAREMIVYDTLGKYVKKIIERDKILNALPHGYINYVDNDSYFGYFDSSVKQENNKFVILTREGFTKTFHSKKDSKNIGFITPLNSILSYRWDDKLYIIEYGSDTLYRIDGYSAIPRYFVQMSETASKSKQMNDHRNHNYLIDIDENTTHLFFRANLGEHYLGFANKKNDKVILCKLNDSGISGFTDDINGLNEIIPHSFTENNEMVFIIQPFDLLNWFKSYPAKAQSANLRMPWLMKISEFSNPIIAIGKCKE